MNLPTVHEAFEHRDEYKYLLWLVETERNSQFSTMSKVKDTFETGKVAGRVDALDWVLSLFTPGSWLDSPYDEE
jgi:hypothetical protein